MLTFKSVSKLKKKCFINYVKLTNKVKRVITSVYLDGTHYMGTGPSEQRAEGHDPNTRLDQCLDPLGVT